VQSNQAIAKMNLMHSAATDISETDVEMSLSGSIQGSGLVIRLKRERVKPERKSSAGGGLWLTTLPE
jgi:hypothetical protein